MDIIDRKKLVLLKITNLSEKFAPIQVRREAFYDDPLFEFDIPPRGQYLWMPAPGGEIILKRTHIDLQVKDDELSIEANLVDRNNFIHVEGIVQWTSKNN